MGQQSEKPEVAPPARRVTEWKPMPLQQHRDLFDERVRALTDAEVLEIFAHTVREAHWLSSEILRRGLVEPGRAP
jgi:hypothetical protein